jgi:hypothetical protein
MQPIYFKEKRDLLHLSNKRLFCKSPSHLFDFGHFINVHFLKLKVNVLQSILLESKGYIISYNIIL